MLRKIDKANKRNVRVNDNFVVEKTLMIPVQVTFSPVFINITEEYFIVNIELKSYRLFATTVKVA